MTHCIHGRTFFYKIINITMIFIFLKQKILSTFKFKDSENKSVIAKVNLIIQGNNGAI